MKKTIFDIFPGIQVYDTKPVEVQNPFSGESYELQPEEVAVYDYLKGTRHIKNFVWAYINSIWKGRSIGVISWAKLPRKDSVGRRWRPPWLSAFIVGVVCVLKMKIVGEKVFYPNFHTVRHPIGFKNGFTTLQSSPSDGMGIYATICSMGHNMECIVWIDKELLRPYYQYLCSAGCE